MLHVAFFLLAIFLPWLLGFLIIRPFLKRRHGYLYFAVGAGYVLGWFLATLVLRVYDYFQRPFDIYEIVTIECVLVIPLLFLKGRALRVDEIQIVERVSKLTWFLTSIIILLLLYRWGLTLMDLLSKPVFPWDGWMSWSAKAKVFYYTKEIFPLAWDGTRFWEVSNNDIEVALVGGARHPYFISLVQTYTALAWGDWSESIVNLPWLGMSITVFFCVCGGLRYLGVKLFPAILTGYMIVSFPILDTHLSLGSYADLWVGFGILIISFMLVVLLALKEIRVLFPLLLFLAIIYLTKNTSLIFLLGLGVVIYWHYFGKIATILLLILLALSLYMLSTWVISVDLYRTLVSLLSSDLPRNLISYNPVANQVFREWVAVDNWHFIFVASLVGFVPFFKCIESKNKKFELLIIAGYAFLLLMLILTFFTHKISAVNFTAYFNRVSLYFIFVYGLIPVSAYYIVSKEKYKI